MLFRKRRTLQCLKALEGGDLRQAEALASRGVSPQTILPLALEKGSAYLVRLLLQKGARAETEEDLWKASSSHREPLEKLKALVDAGNDPYSASREVPTTRVHAACFLGELDFVRQLLDLGIDPLRLDSQGMSLMQMARIGGHVKLAELLSRYGAPEAEASIAEIERAFITRNAFQSQLHEGIKTAFRFAGIVVERMEIRVTPGKDTEFGYFFQNRQVRLTLLESGSVALEISEKDRWVDVLARATPGQLSVQEIRSLLHGILKEILEGGSQWQDSRANRNQDPPPASRLPGHLLKAYEILGLSPGASARDILLSYRRLAKQHHPDRVGGEKEKMARINEAYRVLRKPDGG